MAESSIAFFGEYAMLSNWSFCKPSSSWKAVFVLLEETFELYLLMPGKSRNNIESQSKRTVIVASLEYCTNMHNNMQNNASTTVTGPGTATLAVPARPPGWKSEPVQYKLDQLQCVPTGRQTDGYDIKYTASYLPVHGESEKEEIKPGRQNKEALAGCTRAMKNDSFSQRQASLAVLSISLIIMVTVFMYFELSAIVCTLLFILAVVCSLVWIFFS